MTQKKNHKMSRQRFYNDTVKELQQLAKQYARLSMTKGARMNQQKIIEQVESMGYSWPKGCTLGNLSYEIITLNFGRIKKRMERIPPSPLPAIEYDGWGLPEEPIDIDEIPKDYFDPSLE
jgi:hypothetical protein